MEISLLVLSGILLASMLFAFIIGFATGITYAAAIISTEKVLE